MSAAISPTAAVTRMGSAGMARLWLSALLTATALPPWMLCPWCLHPCPEVPTPLLLHSPTPGIDHSALFSPDTLCSERFCCLSLLAWSPLALAPVLPGCPPSHTDHCYSAEPFLSRGKPRTAWPCVGDGKQPSGSDMMGESHQAAGQA